MATIANRRIFAKPQCIEFRYIVGVTTPSGQSRDLLRSSLDLLVLSLLVDHPHHGYALQKGINQLSGQTIAAGTLYPLLHRLESGGLVAATWDRQTKRGRKIYHVTDAGKRQLKQQATDWQAMLARLQSRILPALRRVAGK